MKLSIPDPKAVERIEYGETWFDISLSIPVVLRNKYMRLVHAQDEDEINVERVYAAQREFVRLCLKRTNIDGAQWAEETVPEEMLQKLESILVPNTFNSSLITWLALRIWRLNNPALFVDIDDRMVELKEQLALLEKEKAERAQELKN